MVSLLIVKIDLAMHRGRVGSASEARILAFCDVIHAGLEVRTPDEACRLAGRAPTCQDREHAPLQPFKKVEQRTMDIPII